jgi:hypothetical protein
MLVLAPFEFFFSGTIFQPRSDSLSRDSLRNLITVANPARDFFASSRIESVHWRHVSFLFHAKKVLLTFNRRDFELKKIADYLL